jgi:hypothetical protein
MTDDINVILHDHPLIIKTTLLMLLTAQDIPTLKEVGQHQTLSLLYYYLTNPEPSVLLPDKPQAFCIIT